MSMAQQQGQRRKQVTVEAAAADRHGMTLTELAEFILAANDQKAEGEEMPHVRMKLRGERIKAIAVAIEPGKRKKGSVVKADTAVAEAKAEEEGTKPDVGEAAATDDGEEKTSEADTEADAKSEAAAKLEGLLAEANGQETSKAKSAKRKT